MAATFPNTLSERPFRPNRPFFIRGRKGPWESILKFNITRVPHPRSADNFESYNRPSDYMPFIRGNSDPKPTYSNKKGSMLLDFYGVPDLSHFYFTPIARTLPFPCNVSSDPDEQDTFPISVQDFARLPQALHFISQPSEFESYRTAETRFRFDLAMTQGGNHSASRSGTTNTVHASQDNASPERPISQSQSPSLGTSILNSIVFPRPAPLLKPCEELHASYENDFCAYRISISIKLRKRNVTMYHLERQLAQSATLRDVNSRSTNHTPEDVNKTVNGSISIATDVSPSKETPNHTDEYTSKVTSDATPESLLECSDPLPDLHVHMMQHFFNNFMTCGYFERLMREMISGLCRLESFNIFAPEMTITETEISDTLNECCICLSELKIGDLSRTLPCSHRMHRDCIDSWLQKSKRCPLCRTAILPN